MELFFEGNDDLGSIGCNLTNHPGLAHFYAVLRLISDRPEVHGVWVGISEVMLQGEWPFSDHLYVVTTASPQQVAEWAASLEPDEPGEGWWNGTPARGPISVPTGARLVTLWWD